MSPRWFRGALVAALLAGLAPPAFSEDRLERFRSIARERLATEPPGPQRERAVGELYEVVDAEVLDSLRAGEPFSAPPFLRERLDAFAETWGGVTLRALRVPGAGRRPPLTFGLYSLSGIEHASSLRVYVGTGADATLAASSTHDGLLDAQAWPPGPDGTARVLAVWTGPPSAHGARAFRAELWDGGAPDRVRRAWSSDRPWPDGLWVTDWRAQPGELLVRYAPAYPGWKPGCPGPLEHEDRYRAAAGGGLALARRRVSNGWRRELGAATERFFRALAEGDARALAALVPASALRGRLPRGLAPEPVCEQGGPTGRVTVAATLMQDGRRVPWALGWTRLAAGWRLQAAGPVLE